MSAIWMTGLAGAAFLISALLMGFREILLRPTDHDYFPSAPSWLRGMMFIYMLALFLTGTNLLFSLQHQAPILVHPVIVALAVVMVIYKAAMAANILNQWLPASVRARLERVQARAFRLARCGRPLLPLTPAETNYEQAEALVELEAQGFVTVPPGARPDDQIAAFGRSSATLQ